MLRSLVRSLFLLAALPLAAADFQFDATGVTATVTPFATTYWACACVGSVGGAGAYAFRQAIVEDTDGDGVVRWEQYNRMMHGLYTIIDGTAGTLAARRS